MISYRDQSATDAITSMASVTGVITTHGLLQRTISRFRLWANPTGRTVVGSAASHSRCPSAISHDVHGADVYPHSATGKDINMTATKGLVVPAGGGKHLDIST
jgi:hypothetical protein